jgi:hypothetical protein
MLAVSGHAKSACLMKAPSTMKVGSAITLMLAPKSEVAEFKSRGFVEIPCPGDVAALRQYVDLICSSKGIGTMRVIDTVALFGRERSSACASARAGLAESGG